MTGAHLTVQASDRLVPMPQERRSLILHIASDYTDGLGESGEITHRNYRPTRAVNNLVEGAEEFDHLVFSMRRMSSPLGVFLKDLGTPRRPNVRVFAYGHFGLPLGIGLFQSFWLVARTIRRVLRERGFEPDAVHAHRLTFDGISGWLLARALNIPLFISIRGEVERKVFTFKPSYRPLMRRIVARAARVFYVSAWYAAELEKQTGVDRARTHLLPNIVEETRVFDQPTRPTTSFLTVLNLNIWQKKGLAALLPAFAQALARTPSLRLGIVGSGSSASIAAVRDVIQRLHIGDRVSLEGALPNAAVRLRMSEAMALVMPSRGETFGMVYIEALFAGTPILYSKGTGIDGFLDGLEVGVAVDPTDIGEISRALTDLAEHGERYRANVAASANELKTRFGRNQVLARYSEIIREGISAARVSVSS